VIRLEDIDHGSQRYRYTKNVLEVATQHPSLSRYLGNEKDGFPSQDDPHFLVILAEIVSDALCARIVERNEEANEDEDDDTDWNDYYRQFSELMTEFLPIAHKTLLPKGTF